VGIEPTQPQALAAAAGADHQLTRELGRDGAEPVEASNEIFETNVSRSAA